ncbi:malonate decarboxylase holo-ACP synthase [Terriglobus tenax]|uniref:malonate decarboxylase holo-ACP synthase n=1 Tax=Terriglobus tenax TaxID=1111115 RepID=UPI0021E070E3|nr:malonate decarboxylase holo-ACP synthase [Terriglobus tenax]
MGSPLVHDLIRIHAGSVSPACVAKPDWVEQSLERSPWVVVRRAETTAGRIAVGVRGHERNQRWGGFIQQQQVEQLVAPAELRLKDLPHSRSGLPASRALRTLEQALACFDLDWGPGGSVAFELASGQETVGIASDLDLVVRSPERLDRANAAELLDVVSKAPGRVDVRLETPVGGFALEEYCRSSAGPLLVRTSTGSLLLQDPWEMP